MGDAIKAFWRDADAVCFDVDSTVIQEEAIDEVAKFCNKGLEVQQLWDDYFIIRKKYNVKFYSFVDDSAENLNIV